jgi:uncharacterized protein
MSRVDRHIAFPFRVDGRGRTAEVNGFEHVRDLLEQLLLVSPGERVNRPTLGAGLMQLVHEPGSEELAAATELLVQGTIQTWLGELVELEAVEVSTREGGVDIAVRYRLRATGERRTDVVRRSPT